MSNTSTEALLPTVLLKFGGDGGSKGEDSWRLADAIEGTQIFGATGSGKTSGSGATIARAFLHPDLGNMGGLVLTAKPDEIDNWRGYLRDVNRPIDDLVELGLGQPYQFNFLDYEFRHGGTGGGLTYNLVSLFLAALSTGEGSVSKVDPYWNDALRELLTNAVDLAVLGVDRVELEDLAAIVRSAPQNRAEVRSATWQAGSRCFELLKSAESRAARLSKARRGDLEQTAAYWLVDFPTLNDRTRSIVVSSFTSKAAGLLRSPLRELFCSRTGSEKDNAVDPRATHAGKVLVLNLPVKLFGEVGRFAQILYKTVWQRATERRECTGDWRPVFLWADEAQYFATSEDMLFQQTARSKLAATVYLTQNLPNYFAMFGGQTGHAAAESLLGNLQTKIFHANGDPTTNDWAERLFGRSWKNVLASNMHATSGPGTSSNPTLVPNVESSLFTTLEKGGAGSSYGVEALLFQGGRKWLSNDSKNYARHVFHQTPR